MFMTIKQYKHLVDKETKGHQNKMTNINDKTKDDGLVQKYCEIYKYEYLYHKIYGEIFYLNVKINGRRRCQITDRPTLEALVSRGQVASSKATH